MRIKGIWDLQIKKKKKMAGTNFILCTQDVTYLQIMSELEKLYGVLCPKSKYFAFCILQRIIGVTRLPGCSSHHYDLVEISPEQSHPI